MQYLLLVQLLLYHVYVKVSYIYIHFFIVMFFIKPVTAEDQSKPLSTFRNKIFKKWHKHIVTFYIAHRGLGVGGWGLGVGGWGLGGGDTLKYTHGSGSMVSHKQNSSLFV